MALVRLARMDDIAKVIALTERWAEEPSTTGHYTYNTEPILRQRLGRFFWIAEEAGDVVGFLLGSLNGNSLTSMHYQVLDRGEDHLSLEQLYVHPDYRNRGIGSQLVASFRTTAKEQGISCCLLLSQNVDWSRTLDFYRKQGFRPWYFTMFTGQSTEERRQDTD